MVAGIEKLGGEVAYDWEFDAKGFVLGNPQQPGPSWLRRLLGKDLFQSVIAVGFVYTQVPDKGMEHLEELTQLQKMYLTGTQVTDAGLEHLKGLAQLQVLTLSGTQVTDAGLKRLKGLSQLQALYLNNTRVTDKGLEQLKGLSQLQAFYLDGTRVTDAGLEKLQEALRNCKIHR